MILTINLTELRYLVEQYGLSGYLSKFRAEDSIKFIRVLSTALNFWDNGKLIDDEYIESEFDHEFTSIIDVEFEDDASELIKHSLVVLTYADVQESCGRYIPRKISGDHGRDFDGEGSNLENEAMAYIESNYDSVVSCMRDMHKYLPSSERFKPKLKIYTQGVSNSNDKNCFLNVRAFLKDEKLMANQSLSVQAAEVDFEKIKVEWKTFVMARLMEEVSTCYVRFVKKELVLSGNISRYQHNEFFIYGACWGSAYLCMFEELIKPKISD